jgi:hypothetical protein
MYGEKLPISRFGAQPGPVVSLGEPLYLIHLIIIIKQRYTKMKTIKIICGMNSKYIPILLLKYLKQIEFFFLNHLKQVLKFFFYFSDSAKKS